MRHFRPVGILETLSQASYSALCLLWIFVNLLCTTFYFAATQWFPAHGPSIDGSLSPFERLWESSYFSLVTATTLGYGDFLPQGASKAVAVAQAAVGVLIFGILIAKLVARRTDAIMSDVHRLTFESIFYHIRQGLFIVRKDFDTLIRDAEHHNGLSEHEWENLSATYLQAQSLIEEISDFYNNGNAYVIDRKREALLIDSVQRTLSRLLRLLASLDHRGVDWRGHQDSAIPLDALVSIIDTVILVWQKRSPNHTIEHFRVILEQQQLLRGQTAAKNA